MGGRKQVGSSMSSSSSLTSELFGSKDSQSHPSSSSGIFSSIFSPSSKIIGGESLHSEVSRKTHSDTWSSEFRTTDEISRINYSESESGGNKDMSSIYEEQIVQPCHLSSSIYYGGQDIYFRPQSTEHAELSSLNKKDGREDDPGIASRGNWWQGSLYY